MYTTMDKRIYASSPSRTALSETNRHNRTERSYSVLCSSTKVFHLTARPLRLVPKRSNRVIFGYRCHHTTVFSHWYPSPHPFLLILDWMDGSRNCTFAWKSSWEPRYTKSHIRSPNTHKRDFSMYCRNTKRHPTLRFKPFNKIVLRQSTPRFRKFRNDHIRH